MFGLENRFGVLILLASTREVYGNIEIHLQLEKYNGDVNPTKLLVAIFRVNASLIIVF